MVASVLAVTVTVGFLSVLLGVLLLPLPDGSQEIVWALVGTLGTGFAMVLSYYFGASRGGDDLADKVSDRDR